MGHCCCPRRATFASAVTFSRENWEFSFLFFSFLFFLIFLNERVPPKMMNDEFLFFFFTSSVSSKSRDAVGWFRFVYSVSPNSGSRLGFFFLSLRK